jgi:hypothetical protein
MLRRKTLSIGRTRSQQLSVLNAVNEIEITVEEVAPDGEMRKPQLRLLLYCEL